MQYDDFEDEIEDELENEIENTSDESLEKVDETDQASENSKDFVKKCMDKFFADKIMHCGGKIPKYILTDPKKINFVCTTSLIDGVDIAYKSMEDKNSEKETSKAKFLGDATEEIKMVNETLKLLSQSGIPQQFAGGMMLIYLKYVKGIKINV